MATSSTSVKRRRFNLWIILLSLLAMVAAAGYGIWLSQQKRPPDLAALQANQRGVGHMTRFEYDKAAADFEAVVRLAPDWLPGRINLGIALMNLASSPLSEPVERTARYRRAIQLFQEVLKQEPQNPYAHYCIGLILFDIGDPNDFFTAQEHFTIVTRVDDQDPAAWYWRGAISYAIANLAARELAITCYRRALQLDPYLNAARLGLRTLLLEQNQRDEADALLQEVSALQAKDSDTPINVRWASEMGHYAQVIGSEPDPMDRPRTAPIPLFLRDEKLQVQLAPGAHWPMPNDYGGDLPGRLRSPMRKRFGGVMVVLDYNRDGRPDLFLLGAVVENRKTRDLLLRNDGDGHFTDVTAEAGLDGDRPSLGCCVADFDNDGYPDLLITGAGEQHLFRNNQHGGFIDVTAQAGLDALKTVCLGATFVDLDQDGDLDLVIAQYADTPERATKFLYGEAAPEGPGLAVFLNVGEALPAVRPGESPPLTVKFQRADKPADLLGAGVSAVALAATDVDVDFDLDLLVLADRQPTEVILNDRLLRFHRTALPESLVPRGTWNGALVLDAGHQDRSDLLVIGPGAGPIWLSHRPVLREPDAAKWFERRATNSPPLIQAHAIDINLDGWTDVVGLSERGKPVLLRNDGHRLVYVNEGLGRNAAWPADLMALSVADINCDGWPDLVTWSETQGLQLYLNQGNGCHSLNLELTGRRGFYDGCLPVRCNADGFGARVTAQAADFRTGAEFTTLSAGLGQSHQPLFLGLGPHTEADLLRVRWPDNTLQAEFSATPSTNCKVLRLQQTNHKRDSCPILFAWNGQRFGFVTDFLGAGSIGESEPDGGHRPPRPEESVKIEADQLQPRDGQYVLKIAEPMDEVTYLDRLQLVVLDHPQDVRVYPDERFESGGPPVTQDLLAFRQEIFPAQARDHHGRDVTATLRHWDRDTVHDFAPRSWLGFAEEHAVELDFGDRLSKYGPQDRLVLYLAGWTDYPYPESIWAAHQAGVEMQAPVLERRDAHGHWQKIADAGFPAGLPRMMTLDVTGKLGGPSCVLRLRTNLQIYWDQIFVAPVLESLPVGKESQAQGTVRATCLEVERATLSARGCMQELSPDGKQPTIYDYDRLEAVPVSRLAGRLTRFGDVTELLRGLDDRFVIFGPGDEVDVRFDARPLPELPAGWTRSYVLRTWGYCKDCAPFTDTGDTIEPLPFRAMPNYPYGPELKYPHPKYQKQFNTRQVGGRR